MNSKLLKQVIADSGMTMTAVAKKSGILRESLYNKINSGNFYASEIMSISQTLRLSDSMRDEIFFGHESE